MGISNYSVPVVISVAKFRPGGRACCLARPEERNNDLLRLEERSFCVEAKEPKAMLAMAWSFRYPARFADFGGANSLCSDNAPPFFRSQLHCLAAPQASFQSALRWEVQFN